jgi:isopentenyl-diphosphate Delta-isomerase
MSEILIDILNEDGSKTGETAHIEDIHVEGHWHKSAHLWIFNCKNQILLQKRSSKMINRPGLWHISASGHVDSGEESLSSIIREAREEIGINVTPQELRHLKQFRDDDVDYCRGKMNKEFVDVYLLIKDVNIDDLVLDYEEVSEVKFVDLNDFDNMVMNRDNTLAPIWEKFEFIINYLRENKSLVEKSCKL